MGLLWRIATIEKEKSSTSAMKPIFAILRDFDGVG
jgi:hypothetical protein